MKSRLSYIVFVVELLLVTLLLAWQLFRFWPSLGANPWNAALLVTDALPVVFLATGRIPMAVSRSPADWLVSFFGTVGPMFLGPGGVSFAPALPCALLMTAGTLINIFAKLSLRGSFGLVAANRGVRDKGAYRIVRHPMYSGYAVTQLGFLLLNPSLANLALCVAALGLQIMRIRAEERILIADPAYRHYAATVAYRLAPGVY